MYSFFIQFKLLSIYLLTVTQYYLNEDPEMLCVPHPPSTMRDLRTLGYATDVVVFQIVLISDDIDSMSIVLTN